jgi:hypothetical protein
VARPDARLERLVEIQARKCKLALARHARMAVLGCGSKGEVSDVNDGLRSSEGSGRSRHNDGRSSPHHFAVLTWDSSYKVARVRVEAPDTRRGKGRNSGADKVK